MWDDLAILVLVSTVQPGRAVLHPSLFAEHHIIIILHVGARMRALFRPAECKWGANLLLE